MSRGEHDQSGLTQRDAGFYTGNMSGETGEGGQPPRRQLRVTLNKPGGEQVAYRPSQTDLPTQNEQLRAQLTYERMMRQAEQGVQANAESEEERVARLVEERLAARENERNAERDAQEARRRTAEARANAGMMAGALQDVMAPLVATVGNMNEAIVRLQDRIAREDEDPTAGLNPEQIEAMELLGVPTTENTRRRRDARSLPEKDIKENLDKIESPEVRENEKREAALSMKRWVRVVLENVDNGNLLLRRATNGEPGKEDILRTYEALDVLSETTPIDEINRQIEQLQNIVGIEKYFSNVQELKPSSEGMPNHQEEVLHSLAIKWGDKYSTGAEKELVTVDGQVVDSNVLQLFVERATLVTGNNPRGNVSYDRLIFFGNRVRTEQMDDALNNPVYLSRQTYDIFSNETEVSEGEETITTHETRVDDPHFESLMGNAYYNYLLYYVTAHNRERAKWRVGKSNKDRTMSTFNEIFAGNDFVARNGLNMIWALPNPENADEVKAWLGEEGRGSVGLLGQRLTNAMDHIIEAHPPEDSGRLHIPVVIERVNGKTMFEQALGEKGTAVYYLSLAEDLLSESAEMKKIYTQFTIAELQKMKDSYAGNVRAESIIEAKIGELSKRASDKGLKVQFRANDTLADTYKRIERGQISEDKIKDYLKETLPLSLQEGFINHVKTTLGGVGQIEVERIRQIDTDPNPDLRRYRAERRVLYEDIIVALKNIFPEEPLPSARQAESLARVAALLNKVPWEELNSTYDKSKPGPVRKQYVDRALGEAANEEVGLPDHIKEYAARFYINMRGWMLYESKNSPRAIYPYMTTVMFNEQDTTERKARGGRKGGGVPNIRQWFKHLAAPYAYSIAVTDNTTGEEWSVAEILRGSKEMEINYDRLPRNFTAPVEAESDLTLMWEGQVNTKEMIAGGIKLDGVMSSDHKYIDEDKYDDLVNGKVRGPARGGYSTFVGNAKSWYWNQKIRGVSYRETGNDMKGKPVRIAEVRTQTLKKWMLDDIVPDIMGRLGIENMDEGIYLAAFVGELAYRMSDKYKGRKLTGSDLVHNIRKVATAEIQEGKPFLTVEQYDELLKILGFDEKGEALVKIKRDQNESLMKRVVRGLGA